MQEIYKFFKITHPERKEPTMYEVSNYGNVKINGIIKKYNTNIKGYIVVSGEYLHRIVANLFIPNPENKPEIDHIDGNRYNNHFTNLRWVTHLENLNNPISQKRKSKTKQQQYKENPELKGKIGPKKGNHYPKMSEAAKNKGPVKEETKQILSLKFSGENNPMYGKKLKDFMTKEDYNKWRNNLKGRKAWNKDKKCENLSGENNGMYGKDRRRWVNKNGIRHLILKEELDNYLNSGWQIGQK